MLQWRGVTAPHCVAYRDYYYGPLRNGAAQRFQKPPPVCLLLPFSRQSSSPCAQHSRRILARRDAAAQMSYDAPSLTQSASVPDFGGDEYGDAASVGAGPQPPIELQKLPLPFLLEDWCARGSLGDDTAPLLAMLAWAQRECEDDFEAEGWAAVGSQCEQSGRSLQRPPEPLAAAEREGSRAADAQLGEGPVAVSLAPPVTGLAATPTLRALPVAEARYGTFGSSRDETPLPEGLKNAALAPLPETMRPGSINAMRFRLPGPGSYTPQQDGRPYRLETVSGVLLPPSGPVFRAISVRRAKADGTRGGRCTLDSRRLRFLHSGNRTICISAVRTRIR